MQERLRFQTCRLKGLAAIAKVVVKAERREDNWLVQDVGKATCAPGAFIGLCLGAAGKLSRVLNEVMCPSMHPSAWESQDVGKISIVFICF